MKSLTRLFVMGAALSCIFLTVTPLFAADTAPAATAVPILVELFTAEGCSSCPPADKLLLQLDAMQPMAGAQLIVLSEHVTYWDQLGWKDPYSSRDVTDRQAAYVNRLKLASPYTPEMVVDGTTEFIGNNPGLAKDAIEKAFRVQKVSVHISGISSDAPSKLHAYVEADAVAKGADIFFVVALNHVESQVERGENKGSHLVHAAVVQSINKVGSADKNHNFAKQVEVKIDPHADLSNMRVIAFLQEHNSGPVIGAAMSSVPAPPQSASK
jgi:hypothetical protein